MNLRGYVALFSHVCAGQNCTNAFHFDRGIIRIEAAHVSLAGGGHLNWDPLLSGFFILYVINFFAAGWNIFRDISAIVSIDR